MDRYDPPHALGSSHGETRVIREAYFEDPLYVPLVQRAYQLWAELEERSEAQLYVKTGGIMIGARDSTVATGAVRSAREHRLPHEILNASEIRARYPGLNPAGDMIGVLEPRAGILFPEKCIQAHLDLARSNGAEIKTNCEVLSWRETDKHVIVQTASDEFAAGNLILAAGPWMPQMISDLGIALEVERQTLLWFEPRQPELYALGRFPIHLWEYEPGKMFYGFPDLGTGVKLAFHHQGRIVSPDLAGRSIDDLDIESLRDVAGRFVPQANGRFIRGTVCLYTNTADGHFILDRHPAHQRVIIASPCSGHGFKFASAIGELLAQMASGSRVAMDLSLFSVERFRANTRRN
jgi:sarcosine oxidase